MSEQYDDLILKALEGTLSEEEQKTLEQWMLQSPDNKKQMEAFKAIWKATNPKGITPDFRTADEWQRLKEKAIGEGVTTSDVKQKRMWSRLLRIAAAAAIVVLASVGIHWLSQDKHQHPQYTVVDAKGVITTTILPDGSKITLNKTGQLIYDDSFDDTARVVSFKGEAFFDIKRNPERRFVIQTDNASIEVLGTSFNVRAMEGEENTTVYVATGNVKVFDRNTNMISLLPGETGIYNTADHSLIKDSLADQNALAWRDKKLTFKATKLHRVITSLEQYFDIKIELKEEKLGECRFTSNFDNPTLEEVIEAISVSLDLEFKSTATNHYTVGGKGCP